MTSRWQDALLKIDVVKQIVFCFNRAFVVIEHLFRMRLPDYLLASILDMGFPSLLPSMRDVQGRC